MTQPLSQRITNIGGALGSVLHFLSASTYARRQGQPGIADFVFGNPHEMPLPAFVDALQQWSAPQNKDWFAYKMSEPSAQRVVANTLRSLRGMPFEPEDIVMTNGAFAALAVILNTIIDPGDEVIFNIPPWFFYESQILASGARGVRVNVDPQSFDLDLAAIEAAITPKTRAIIVNSPNNPTGKIYPPETLTRLAQLLTDASARIGRTIYLLSDEAYNRILFDGRDYPTPTAFYPHSLMIYTYGKTLLTPGQRIGYIALPPTLPEREALRNGLLLGQLTTGWAFPNALLQHALPDLERASVDIEHLQEKRDRMVAGLREAGYHVHSPEGTFYLLPRAPIADDLAFTEMLAERDVFCLPGTVVEMPGFFRISLTANDEMITRALPAFADAYRAALQRA